MTGEIALLATVASIVLKTQLLREKVKFVLGAADGIERLRKELILKEAFLRDAEHITYKSDTKATLVSEIRDLTYEAEDLIDTFDLKLEREADISKWCEYVCFIKKKFTSYKLGHQVEKLNKKASDISTWRKRYELSPNYVSNQRKSEERVMREINSYTDNEFIVGLDEEANTLRDKLTNGDSKLSVVYILGMGGIGKTTLANRLYNELRYEFTHHAWICVSQEFKIEDILKQLIKSLSIVCQREFKEMTLPDLLETLRGGLTKNKFLIVFDDVWTKEAWINIKKGLPNEDTHSRIIVTTRMVEVTQATNGFILNQENLNETDSWDLFCRKAFPNDADMKDTSRWKKYGEELVHLGRAMVERCNGLPLAIITLGALLHTKSKTVDEWRGVMDNLYMELQNADSQIDGILSLSFNCLPDHLKLCLLYVGMSREDSQISVLELMRMWEAEGFLISNGNAKAEHIAKSCFNELVGRSLIHKTTEDWIVGSCCRVHDLIRDLVIKKAKETRYSEFYGKNNTSDFRRTQNQRRLSLVNYDIRNNEAVYRNKSLRTLHLVWWESEESSYPSFLKKLLKSPHPQFPLLTVLKIHIWGEIPDLHIGELIGLRYLDLWSIKPITLPETLGDLKYLQTLSVRTVDAKVELPKTVVKLRNLKHLLGDFKNGACWIGELEGLETLQIAHFGNWIDLDTAKLSNLLHLTLNFKVYRSVSSAVLFSEKFKNLKKLQKLELIESSIPCKISETLRLCPDITHVYLPISVGDDLVFHEFGSNLQVLEFPMLQDNHFSDLMRSLEKLPQLRALRFEYFIIIENREFTCSPGGFSQLRTLEVSYFEVTDKRYDACNITLVGDMPMLTNLTVDPPHKLIRLKRSQQQIENVQEITTV